MTRDVARLVQERRAGQRWPPAARKLPAPFIHSNVLPEPRARITIPVRHALVRRWGAVALCLSVGRAVQGQPAVTLRQAVDSALIHGARAAVAGADLAASLAQLRMARALPNPTATASYTKATPQYHAAIELPVEYPWLRSARIGAARSSVQSSRYTVTLERARIRHDVTVFYVRALAAADRSILSRRSAMDGDSLLRLARVRRDAGDASDLDVDLSTIATGQLLNAALADSLAAISAVVELQTLIGLATDRPTVGLADSLALPPDDSVLVSGTPLRVAAAEAALRAAEQSLALERRSVLGTPAISAGFETGDPTGAEPGLLPTVGVSLPLPFLSRREGEIALATANRDRARALLALARLESQAEIATAMRERRAAILRARRDLQLRRAADRVAAMALTAYAEGAVALPYVLEVQRNAREALAQYIDDVAAARIADAALLLATMQAPSPP
ncbi:MAG: TolC family protein [Gemmatimonadaceae bacterium]